MKKWFVCLLVGLLLCMVGCSGTVDTETDTTDTTVDTAADTENDTETESAAASETSEAAPDEAVSYYNYALDVPLRLESGRNQSVLEAAQIIGDGDVVVDNPAALAINARMQARFDELSALAAESDVEDYVLQSFCFTTDRYLSVVTLYNCYPSYGTYGTFDGFCFDKETGVEVTLEDALAMAGVTMDDLAASCKACAEENGMEGKSIDSLYFRIQPDGKPEFFIGYNSAVPGADDWAFDYAWYDGSCVLAENFPAFVASETDYVLSGELSYQTEYGGMHISNADEIDLATLTAIQQYCYDEHALADTGLVNDPSELPVSFESYGEYDGATGWWLTVYLIRTDDGNREEFLERFFVPDGGSALVYDAVTDTRSPVPMG